MTRTLQWLLTAVTVVVLGGVMARGQQNPQIDPDAMAALKDMGAYLRTLKAFQVQASTSTEHVLDDGQKVQFDGKTDVLVKAPDRFRIEVQSDRRERLWVYDGRQFSMLAKRVNMYATVPAPPTIAQLSDTMRHTYDMELPLEDLFTWGGPRSRDEDIKSAMVVGPSAVDGVSCAHYAFRQDGLDWQVWIQRGDAPLPRKLVLTTLTDDARPQYAATFAWNLAPSYDEGAFAFVPPKDAAKVVLDNGK